MNGFITTSEKNADLTDHGYITGVSASGIGRIGLESPCPAMPDTEPILTGMATCPALHFSYKFPGSK